MTSLWENDQVGEETWPTHGQQEKSMHLTSYFPIPRSRFVKGEAHGEAKCFPERRTQTSGQKMDGGRFWWFMLLQKKVWCNEKIRPVFYILQAKDLGPITSVPLRGRTFSMAIPGIVCAYGPSWSYSDSQGEDHGSITKTFSICSCLLLLRLSVFLRFSLDSSEKPLDKVSYERGILATCYRLTQVWRLGSPQFI